MLRTTKRPTGPKPWKEVKLRTLSYKETEGRGGNCSDQFHVAYHGICMEGLGELQISEMKFKN
jgi:hypothetical protein